MGRNWKRHVVPHFLPDGSGVLFTQLGPAEPNVALWSRDTEEWSVVIEAGSGARHRGVALVNWQLTFAATGCLVGISSMDAETRCSSRRSIARGET